MAVQYVNAKGEPIDPFDPAKQVKPKARSALTDEQKAEGHHKGWKVVGYPPGTIEKAQKEHEAQRLRVMKSNIGAMHQEREPAPWSASVWKARHKPRAVRAKPYELQSAAAQCMRMAERAGWVDVLMVEVKKEPAKKD